MPGPVQMPALLVALAAAGFAAAGSLWTAGAEAQRRQPVLACSVADHVVLLDLLLPLAPGGAADAAGMAGELQIHHPRVPHDRRRWPLAKRLPAHFWLHGNELKLRLVFGGAEAPIVLVIETQRRTATDDAFAGNWTLFAAETPRLTGRITCGVSEV